MYKERNQRSWVKTTLEEFCYKREQRNSIEPGQRQEVNREFLKMGKKPSMFLCFYEWSNRVWKTHSGLREKQVWSDALEKVREWNLVPKWEGWAQPAALTTWWDGRRRTAAVWELWEFLSKDFLPASPPQIIASWSVYPQYKADTELGICWMNTWIRFLFFKRSWDLSLNVTYCAKLFLNIWQQFYQE